MKISELQDGQVVRSRVGKHGDHAPDWQEWGDHTLYVQRTKTGEICTITLRDINWAEFDPRTGDFYDGLFSAEEYLLEIEGLER